MADVDLQAFDTKKADESSKRIRAELDKLTRLKKKITDEKNELPKWWVGDSNRAVLKQLNELVEALRKACDFVSGMNDDLTAVSDAKKENERLLKNDLSQYPSMLASAAASDGGHAATGPTSHSSLSKTTVYGSYPPEYPATNAAQEKPKPEDHYTAAFQDWLIVQERNNREKYYTAAFEDWVREQEKSKWKRPADYYAMVFQELLQELVC